LRLTRVFMPTLKETPAEAQIVSHRLMLRAGLIRQTSAGIYAWLPAGLRVLRTRRADRPRGAGPAGARKS
jgi:prolyl-tRNA synthetase